MNAKQAKKLRQMARREMAAVGLTREQVQESFRLQIKPAPRWCPDVVWTRLAQLFLAPGSPIPKEP